MRALEVINPEWKVHPRVRAVFTLREGGVSAGPFGTLNLGVHVGDDSAAVAENRRRVHMALGLPSEPVWLQQVHGVRVLDLDASREANIGGIADVGGGADGSVTRTAGRVCAILVADCIPVLFAATNGSVVAAAHAGWRGLAAGVLDATVAAMCLPPSELSAWLGPGIGQAHFEVGDDVREAFLSNEAAAFKRNARGRWQCDLAALARLRLARLGVADVHGGGLCTYADARRFFSFRRDGQCGRMAALIWLQGVADARATMTSQV